MAEVKNQIAINCCEDRSKALIFNEDLDEFVGEVSYPTVIYGTIYSEFFTTGLSYLTEESYLWRHDMPDYLWYYGTFCEMQISYYENGSSEQQSTAPYTKNFESQNIHSKESDFYRIDYATEYQEGEIYPFINAAEFWKTPEYLEHHWQVPIMVKTDADDEDYETDSSMQGTWLKTTLRYKSLDDFYVKNVVTNYRLSRI